MVKKIPNILFNTVNNTIINTYEVGNYLGKGAWSKCYIITDKESGIEYVGKFIPKNKLNIKRTYSFDNEVIIHSWLSHPNIVNLLDILETNNFVIIIMEYCNNGDMLNLIKTKSLTELEIKKYLRQMLNAIEYIHNEGIIHRDIKLGNIFLNDDNIKIGDFGMAMYIYETSKILCGTPNYVAPEIITRKPLDDIKYSIKSDIWSLGVVLYTMVVGKAPFETTSLNATFRRIKHVMYYFPDRIELSDNIKDLISSMLQKSPFKRPSITDIKTHKFLTDI